MNRVNIAGKVVGIKVLDKVAYITIAAKSRHVYEYIDITSFSPDFVNKYVEDCSYIAVDGTLHRGDETRNYKLEVIADSISLMGSKQIDNNPNKQKDGAQFLEEIAAQSLEMPW